MTFRSDLLCSDVPLTNPERLELYRRKRWATWLDEPERRDKPVLWEWLRLCWGNGAKIGRQAW